MDSHVDSICKFWVAYLRTYLFIHLCILWEVLVGPTILYIILNIAVCTCQSQIPYYPSPQHVTQILAH